MTRTDIAGEIRNYLFLDLMMSYDQAQLLALSAVNESEFTMEDPWDIVSRELMKLEDNNDLSWTTVEI